MHTPSINFNSRHQEVSHLLCYVNYLQGVRYKDQIMKLLFKKVLSLHEDGASCFLIIFEEQFKIMLDCGINPNFDLSKYRLIADELKDVKVVLISHSALEYSGAFPFLVSEFGMSPKAFYTTQPIMRYSPLSIHEELLNMRLPNYNRKVFNRIYSYFQQMHLIKPHQKKEIELLPKTVQMVQQSTELLRIPIKTIQFACYLAGGYLGGLYWRISYGLVNILYLVEYNNYSMNHINGLDFDNLATIPTHLLITDSYPRTEIIKKNNIYQEIMQLVLNFYNKNHIEPNKPKTFSSQYDQQLLIACYPSELIVEMLFVLRKVVSELQESGISEKIGVIHLSSRFLQLIKSQSQYYSSDFKGMLQKMNEYFEQSVTLDSRINVCSIHSLKGILAESNKNVQVYYAGGSSIRKPSASKDYVNNIRGMKLFDEEEERLLRSASKISISKIQSKMEIEQKIQQKVEEEVSMEPEVGVKGEEFDDDDLLLDENKFDKKNFNSKFIALFSGIPRFNLNKRQKDQEITELGIRHHIGSAQTDNAKNVYLSAEESKPANADEKLLSKKQSKVQVMNIRFDLPSPADIPYREPLQLSASVRNFHKTEYKSSLRVINHIKPKDIIFVNMPLQGNLLSSYLADFSNFKDQRKISAFDSNVKKLCYLSYSNELLEYKMNYLPEMQQKKVQRIKGTIIKTGNILQIHLDCLEDSEIATFRLEMFFGLMQGKMKCVFTGVGIEIEGIKLYRKDNSIIMEGEYSEEYFKVRKALYQFLGIR